MSEIDPKVQAPIDELAKHQGLPPNAIGDIKAAIASSPYLEGLTKHAVDNGDLQHLGISNRPHSGGHTSAKDGDVTASIQQDVFKEPDDRKRLDAITETIAHEVRHAMNQKDVTTEWSKFNNDVWNAFVEADHDRSPSVNVTPLAQRMQDVHRYNEARASVAELNALASRIEKENGGRLDEVELLDRSGSLCVTHPTDGSDSKLAKGLAFNDKDRIQTHGAIDAGTHIYSPHPNVEFAAQCYFDADAGKTRLGMMGLSDYPNNYGASAIRMIANRYDERFGAEKPGPDVQLDMKTLGWKADQIEGAGLDLGKRTRFSIVDGSDGMNVVTLHRSLTTSRGSARDIAESPDAPSSQRPSPSPADAAHPDHATLEQIRAGVRAVRGQIGADDDASVERLSHSLLAATKDQRDAYPHTRNEPLAGRELGRVDQVMVGGSNLFAVEGRLDDPAMKRAFVNIEQAMQTPVAQSDQKLQAANQQITQEQTVTRQQELVQAQPQEAQRAPMLTR